MPYNFDSEQQVKDFFGSTRHYRGTILRARYVGPVPPLEVDGHQLLSGFDVWDFLVRTRRGRYVAVRGDLNKEGQTYGGNMNTRSSEDWWTFARRKDAEEVFEKLARLAEPVSNSRGGGAAFGGSRKSPEEYARMKAAGEVNNKE